MHPLVDDSALDDVLLTLRLAALFTPGRELTAEEVAATCWVSRPPSCFQMSARGAAEALKELVKDGYAERRRARTNLFRLDPDDRRAPLPNGYRYARRTHYSPPAKPTTYEVVVTPLWGNGGRLWLPVEGDSVTVSTFRLSWQHQSPGVRPLTEAQVRYWVSTLTQHGWVPDGDRIRCPLENGPRLRGLAFLARDIELRGAAAVSDREGVEREVARAEKEEQLCRLTAHWRA